MEVEEKRKKEEEEENKKKKKEKEKEKEKEKKENKCVLQCMSLLSPVDNVCRQESLSKLINPSKPAIALLLGSE